MLADSAHERKRPGASGPVDPVALSAAITPILEGLERSRWHGAELSFRCPAPDHEDRNPSASWKPDGGRGSGGVWHCHKGTCGAHGGALDLASLLGIDVDPYRTAGALPEIRNGSGPTNGAPKAERLPAAAGEAPQGKRPQTLEALRRRNGCTVYEYQDADGQGIGLSIRVNPADGGKRFELWRAAAGGWLPGRLSGKYPLYRLPAVQRSTGPVYLVEGEKCADALADVGLTGTTCIMGAGKAKETDLTPLQGRPVVILPDADDAGRAHAQECLLYTSCWLPVVMVAKARPSASVKSSAVLPMRTRAAAWLSGGFFSPGAAVASASSSTAVPPSASQSETS